MKITHIETWSVPVTQEIPYAVAYTRFEKTDLVFLRLTTDTNIVGYGSASCDQEVTGETSATVLAALNNIAAPILRGSNPLTLLCVVREMERAIGKQPSALAAVDMALFDIFGKIVGLPLWKLLGGCRDRIRTSVTIGILPLAETLESTKQWFAKGFDCLKLKGGLDVDSDIERVIRVRELFGDTIELRFDANQGYSVEQALQFLRDTRQARIAFIEQPTLAAKPELLGDVQQAGIVPVMADECLLSPFDALGLAKRELVDMFNVKLMKSGGIAAALEIESIARAATINIMVGCMDESVLGIAAGLHFALARPATTMADLDGHLGLIGDPAFSTLRLENGVLFPPDEPGLGVKIRET